jgi:hypothetical protein
MCQVNRAMIDVIEQAAGTGDNDLDTCPQLLYLWVNAYPAIDGDAPEAGLLSHGNNCLVDLLCQFAGRRDNESPNMPAFPLHQAFQDRKNEGRCFSGTGLCQAHDVASLQYRRDRLYLDRRR